jgi:hypothetical protein
MAIRNGFKPHSVVAINIPNTQISGDWSGISTPITTLDSGVYYFTYNISYVPIGVGPISTTLTAITTVLPWVDVNTNIVCSSPNTGHLGGGNEAIMYQSLSGTAIITTDNTPVYLKLYCAVTGTWGSILPTSNQLNRIVILKLSSA